MYEQVEKPKENTSRAVANSVGQTKSRGKQGFGFVDNRAEFIAQKMQHKLSYANLLGKQFGTVQKCANNVIQLIKVTSSDLGKSYDIIRNDNNLNDVGALVSIDGGGWYTFNVKGSSIKVRGEQNILKLAGGATTFSTNGISFSTPTSFSFTSSSALNATKPMFHGGWKTLTGMDSKSGVEIGDYGSYGGVQHLEKTGDKLTGDHQPSGASIKEAIRLELHRSLNQVLTRGMAKNAYKKAITIVMTDAWHKISSRTYGGRNTKTQIIKDAQNLVDAAIKDWEETVSELKKSMPHQEIIDIWDGLNTLRQQFFSTGDAQWM